MLFIADLIKSFSDTGIVYFKILMFFLQKVVGCICLNLLFFMFQVTKEP